MNQTENPEDNQIVTVNPATPGFKPWPFEPLPEIQPGEVITEARICNPINADQVTEQSNNFPDALAAHSDVVKEAADLLRECEHELTTLHGLTVIDRVDQYLDPSTCWTIDLTALLDKIKAVLYPAPTTTEKPYSAV